MVTKAKKRERRARRGAAAANRVATRRTREKEESAKTTELLTSESELKKDMPLIQTAVKHRWPVAPEKAQVLVDRLVGIAEKTVVMVPCGEGIAPSESVADTNSIKAIALLQAMTKQNHAEEQKQNTGPSVGPQTTINVGVSVDAAGIDERRSRVAAIAERFRAGGVLLVDQSGQDQ